MSLIPNLSDIPELTPVAPGEYSLRITKAIDKTAQTGRKGLQMIIEIIGEDNAATIFDNLWFPLPSEDPAKQTTMWRMVKDKLAALGLPTDGTIELSDFANLEFTAILDIETDPDYGDKNIIKRII